MRGIEMSKRSKLHAKIFEREWNKRFRMVNEDGMPLELPKAKQCEDYLSDEGLSEEQLEAQR